MAITEYATAEFAAAQAAVDRHTIELRQAKRDLTRAHRALFQAIHCLFYDAGEVERALQNYAAGWAYTRVLAKRIIKARKLVARMRPRLRRLCE